MAMAFVVTVTGAVVLPLAYGVTRGLPLPVAVAIFLTLQAIVFFRVRYLPRPYPPPVWFERWCVWGYFLCAAHGMWFTPIGGLTWWLAGSGWPLDVAFGVSVALAMLSAGVPWRRVVEPTVEVVIPGLPAAFDGFRIVQLTDLHAGPMVPRRWLAAWVRRTNRRQPDAVALTGDLIASGTAFVPGLEGALSGLKAPVYAVMGNHDYFAGGGDALLGMHQRLGHHLLDNRAIVLERQGARLVLAGVDDTWSGRDDLEAALTGLPEAPVVLLAHDPILFPDAVQRGVALQISGHVHGGQLQIPLMDTRGSPLRWFGFPFVRGLYRSGHSQLWLGAGLGTTGAPVRVGVPSELPMVVLRGARSPSGAPSPTAG